MRMPWAAQAMKSRMFSVSAQRGHGAAIGGAGGVGGEDFVDAGALGALEAGIVGALPGGASSA